MTFVMKCTDRQKIKKSILNTYESSNDLAGKQQNGYDNLFLVIMPTEGDNQSVTPGSKAVQQLRFLVLTQAVWGPDTCPM